MLKKVDYDERQYRVYAQGRALPEATVDAWMAAFARHAGRRPPLTVLDLGSGTGRFTPALARTFGGPVFGVEPANRMREVAEVVSAHPDVTYLAGSAERIPLPDRSCDLVLMYLVLQHIRDRPAAAAQVARVLRPGGRLLVQSTFTDRMPDLIWHRYFERARDLELEMFLPLPRTVDLFTAAGLRFVALDQVRHRFAPSLADYTAKMRLRPVSLFEHISEEEIERGFARMEADAAAETTPVPVETDLDLLVMAAAPD